MGILGGAFIGYGGFLAVSVGGSIPGASVPKPRTASHSTLRPMICLNPANVVRICHVLAAAHLPMGAPHGTL